MPTTVSGTLMFINDDDHGNQRADAINSDHGADICKGHAKVTHTLGMLTIYIQVKCTISK